MFTKFIFVLQIQKDNSCCFIFSIHCIFDEVKNANRWLGMEGRDGWVGRLEKVWCHVSRVRCQVSQADLCVNLNSYSKRIVNAPTCAHVTMVTCSSIKTFVDSSMHNLARRILRENVPLPYDLFHCVM